jgi:hypothetical protein
MKFTSPLNVDIFLEVILLLQIVVTGIWSYHIKKNNVVMLVYHVFHVLAWKHSGVSP